MRVPSLTQDAVTLRPWSVADARWFVNARDEVVFANTTEPRDLTVAELEIAIRGTASSPSVAAWAIERNGSLVGSMAVVVEGANADISYWLAPAGRGRGVATTAVGLALDWCWLTEIDRVEAQVMVGNAPSKQVLARNGFVATGESRSAWLLDVCHHGIGCSSRKKPPVGPSGGSVAAQVKPAAPSVTGRPLAPPMGWSVVSARKVAR
jgi:RimJ/RimL family protein N-acetyltransferase